jgi:hypothetical protein
MTSTSPNNSEEQHESKESSAMANNIDEKLISLSMNNSVTASLTKGEVITEEGENEAGAQVAASQGGKICRLKYLISSVPDRFDKNESGKSIFYFSGEAKLKQNSQAATRVFCKVWKSEDSSTDLHNIEKEKSVLEKANEQKVCCPCLIEELSTFNLSTSLGTYHVITMANMIRDQVLPKDILTYAKSLINTCKQLHGAGILHCDIKPIHLSWDSHAAIVFLLGFGHAQLESEARMCRGTKGFEAPEVITMKQPNSRASDTYSVGKTLLKVLDDFGVVGDGEQSSEEADYDEFAVGVELKAVRHVAEKLCMEDGDVRWSLMQAELELDTFGEFVL